MTERKTQTLGYDPLAWMQEDAAPAKNDGAPQESAEVGAKTAAPAKNTARKTIPKPKAPAYESPLGLDVETLEESFALLAPICTGGRSVRVRFQRCVAR